MASFTSLRFKYSPDISSVQGLGSWRDLTSGLQLATLCFQTLLYPVCRATSSSNPLYHYTTTIHITEVLVCLNGTVGGASKHVEDRKPFFLSGRFRTTTSRRTPFPNISEITTFEKAWDFQLKNFCDTKTELAVGQTAKPLTKFCRS